jgi:hypothetical protein
MASSGLVLGWRVRTTASVMGEDIMRREEESLAGATCCLFTRGLNYSDGSRLLYFSSTSLTCYFFHLKSLLGECGASSVSDAFAFLCLLEMMLPRTGKFYIVT